MPDRWPPLLSAFSAICDGELGRLAEALGLAFGAALFGDLVELGLGLLDLGERSDFLTGVERALDQVAPDADQRPKQRQIVDLLRRNRCAPMIAAPGAGQLRQIGRPAELLHRLVGLEQRPQASPGWRSCCGRSAAGSLRRSGRAAARRNGAASSLSWTSSTSRLSIISAPSSAASASTFCGSAALAAGSADSAIRMTSAMTSLRRSAGHPPTRTKVAQRLAAVDRV